MEQIRELDLFMKVKLDKPDCLCNTSIVEWKFDWALLISQRQTQNKYKYKNISTKTRPDCLYKTSIVE